MTPSKLLLSLFTSLTLLLGSGTLVHATEKTTSLTEQQQIESWTKEGLAAYARDDMMGAIMTLGKSARKGHAPAQAMLGYIYNQGSEQELALPLFEQAAAQGDNLARFELSNFYRQGIIVKTDRVKAMTLVKQAADTGYAPALYSLAHAYEVGAEPLSVDLQQAVKYYQLAVDHKHSGAARRLINAYTLGELGFAIDLIKAEQLEQALAQQQPTEAEQ
jgi:TPR repeat protein